MSNNGRIKDYLRDELARRARRRGLSPHDLAVAVADLPESQHVGTIEVRKIVKYFAGEATLRSPQVSLLAQVLGLRWTEDIWEAQP